MRTFSLSFALQCLQRAKMLRTRCIVLIVGHLLHAGHAVARGFLLRGKDRSLGLLKRKRRDDAVNQRHGRIFEHAGRIAVRIAHNHAAGHILRIAIDAGKLHGQRVRQSHMAIEPHDKNRILGCHVIDQLMGWEHGGCPAFVIPYTGKDPCARRLRLGETSNALAKLRL